MNIGSFLQSSLNTNLQHPQKYIGACSLAYGDYCYSDDRIDVRVALQGDRIHVTASAPTDWVGIGVPKSADFTEMPRGNFVLGGGGQLHQYSLAMDYNWKPDVPTESVVEGTVSSGGQRTNLSFTRMLVGPNLNPIDPTKPFNLLWATGALNTTLTGYAAFQYHHTTRGYVRVDLVHDNCVSLNVSSAAGRRAGKKGKKGKRGKKAVCTEGHVVCTAKLQKEGLNCVLGACVLGTKMTAKPAPGCATILCATNTPCINGRCVPLANGGGVTGST